MSLTLHTTLGDLKLELHCDRAPIAAFNFLALAASGAYDGTPFHRNVKGFVVQGGAPAGGKGKGGECVWGGLMPDQFCAELKHDIRGVVSMASSKPDRVGSQFFVTYAPQPHLDGVQSVCGKVLFGWDTLDKMERAPVTGKKYRPETPIVVERVTIHANPFADAGRTIPPPLDRVEPDPTKPKKKRKRKNEKSQAKELEAQSSNV
jgi:peptidyl-prolyl cis-trans isomerase-like 3